MKREHFGTILKLALSTVCVFTLTGCSSDWPAFRHNTLRSGNQVNHGPLTDPAKVAGLTIGWTFPVGAVTPAPGPFRAGPVVYDGVVYAGNSNGYLYAINAKNGSLKWVTNSSDFSIGCC